MKKTLFALCLAACAAVALLAVSSAAPAPMSPVIITPGAVKWMPVKGMGGLQSAVLFGDPSKAGSEYAIRYELPDGFKFPPHMHPLPEQVTVISGTFMVGLGNTITPAKMLSLPAGSYVALPAKVHHYAVAKGVTVVEVHGVGPFQIIWVK